MGDNKTAKNAYRKSIQIDRENVNSYIGLALILLRLGEYDNAKWAYEKVVELDPKNPQAYELRGRILMKKGQSKEATDALKKAQNLYEGQKKWDAVARIDAMLLDIEG